MSEGGDIWSEGDRIYHLTTRSVWDEAELTGTYSASTRGKTIDEVGFIHASQSDQLAEVANLLFLGTGQELLVLMMSREALIEAGLPVILEDGGNGQFYPHIYAPLPCALVDEVRPAAFGPDGEFIFQY